MLWKISTFGNEQWMHHSVSTPLQHDYDLMQLMYGLKVCCFGRKQPALANSPPLRQLFVPMHHSDKPQVHTNVSDVAVLGLSNVENSNTSAYFVTASGACMPEKLWTMLVYSVDWLLDWFIEYAAPNSSSARKIGIRCPSHQDLFALTGLHRGVVYHLRLCIRSVVSVADRGVCHANGFVLGSCFVNNS